MKKMVALLLSVVAACALFASCSGNSSGVTVDVSVAPSEETQSEDPEASALEKEEAEAASAQAEESEAASEQGEVLKRIIDNGKLVMLTNAAFPPYEYIGSSNEPEGVDVDISQAIADEIGVELEVVNMEFDSLIPAMLSGKGDIVAAGMTVTEERAKSVDFTDTYANAEQKIVVPKEGATVKTEEDLAGKTIGVQLGTTGDLYVSDNVEGADIKQYKSALEAAMDLKNGRLDAVVIDVLPAENIAESNDDLELIDMESTNEQYAIAIEKGNEDLVDIVNAVIARLIADGDIESMTATHVEASRV